MPQQKAALDAPDATIDALLKVDLPEVDAQRAAEDRAADMLAEESAGGFTQTKQAPVAQVERPGEPLISKEEATRRLGPKVMAALADKFNGSLTDIRYPDESDLLF